MPLLNKNPFVPNEPPPDLKENEEVFFCRLTREIFRDYEQFCERIILCNSLVWSCSLTGRSQLTYQEAAASEDKVKRLLKRFPMELRIPVLYLASLCERRSLVDLAEDVFSFVKDRFFIGETVEVALQGKGNKPDSVQCHILAVIPPSKEEIESYQQQHHKNGERFHWVPPNLYKYEVERMDNGEEALVSGDQITRKKSSYSKDKNRLYIKQFFHNTENGIWKLKESSNSKYGISKVRFDQIFCGQAPDMTVRKLNSGIGKKHSGAKRQETLNKYFKSTDKKIGISPRKSPKKSSDILDRRGPMALKRKRRTKKELEEEALRLGSKGSPAMRALEAKRKAREEKKERKKNLAEFLREWSMKREDLECEDLKPLPVPELLRSRLPNEYIGDAIMLMEFLHSFRTILPVKDFFPHGLTFDVVERALVDKEIAGPLSDVLQLLLTSIFDLLEQESDEIKETDVKITPGLIFTRGGVDTIKIVKAATVAEAWARKHHHSVPLSQLSIDPTTVTEVLRLHILTSGAVPAKSKVAKWRYQARGGYCNNDDPAVDFKLKRPQLLEKLAQTPIFEFSTEEKIAVLNCLMEQIITYSSLRDTIEEGCEKARLARIELRTVRAAEVKKEKEEALRLKAEKKNGIINNPDEKKLPKENRELRSLGSEKPDLLEDIRLALANSQLAPLGCDSAHRRYWIFSSVPGLFVEEGEENPGPCIPNGTPFVSGSNPGNEEDHLAYIRKLFEESSKDKENLPGRVHPPQVSPVKRHLLSEKNGEEDNTPVNGEKNEDRRRGALVCSGDPDSCPIHGPNRQKSWSHFTDPGHIDQLIEGLNRRGFRERKLRIALTQHKDAILERLSSCPADRYNNVFIPSGAKSFTEHQNKAMKQYDQANTGFPRETAPETVLETNLREFILEVEEKIFMGVVGGIKVKNRDTWREAIKNFSYDQQCKKLTWGTKGLDDNSLEMNTDDIKEEPMDEEIKKEVDGEESRASTPSLDDGRTSAWPGIHDVPQRQVITDLASAILQLSQGIEFKYFKKPLGSDSKEKDIDKKNVDRSQMQALGRWEDAVMSSTSLPQLFLYLSTLDNSVSWERSALHASCRICRKKKDPESMLLCDTCNKGHHLYCLKPKLTRVPSGDWHCPRCRPKEKQSKSPVKKRRLFSEDSDGEEEAEQHECNSCGDKGAQLECGTCETRLHLACVMPPMRRVPKSKWFCHDCRNANSQQTSTPSNRKSNGTEVKMEIKEEEMEEDSPKPAKSESSSRARTAADGAKRKEIKERNSTARDRNSTATPPPKVKINGHVNGVRKHDIFEEDLAEERSSRRKCSKAATAKISQFAKQLRSSNLDGDSDEEWDDESSTPTTERSRRDRRSSRRSEGRKGRDLPLDNAALQEILDVLMHDVDAPPFLRPVAKSEAPDYHEIVKKPMDFGTIKHKLNMLSYKKNSDLIADAELLFNNCSLYNDENTDVYKAGEKLRNLFYKLCKEHNLLDEDIAVTEDIVSPPSKRTKTEL